MIFHCTKALVAKIPEVWISPLSHTNPMGSWHAQLLSIYRRHWVMFCHDSTRFILFQAGLRKEHFRNLGQIHKALFRSALTSLEVPESIIKRIELVMGPAKFNDATISCISTNYLETFESFGSSQNASKANKAAFGLRCAPPVPPHDGWSALHSFRYPLSEYSRTRDKIMEFHTEWLQPQNRRLFS